MVHSGQAPRVQPALPRDCLECQGATQDTGTFDHSMHCGDHPAATQPPLASEPACGQQGNAAHSLQGPMWPEKIKLPLSQAQPTPKPALTPSVYYRSHSQGHLQNSLSELQQGGSFLRTFTFSAQKQLPLSRRFGWPRVRDSEILRFSFLSLWRPSPHSYSCASICILLLSLAGF